MGETKKQTEIDNCGNKVYRKEKTIENVYTLMRAAGGQTMC